jgi:hypothetical protein
MHKISDRRSKDVEVEKMEIDWDKGVRYMTQGTGEPTITSAAEPTISFDPSTPIKLPAG